MEKKLSTAPAPTATPPQEETIVAFEISAELAENILAYLTSRPWKEVNHLIHGLSTTLKAIKNEEKNNTASN